MKFDVVRMFLTPAKVFVSEGRYPSCHEISESRRSVKLKDMKERNFPLYALKLWPWAHIDIHPLRASYSYGNSQLWHLSKVKGSSPGRRPTHSLLQTPAIKFYHGPFFPDIKTSFVQTLLHGINPSLPWPTH